MRGRPVGGDGGVAMVSYALLVVLIALGAFTAVKTVGTSTSDSFDAVAGSMPGGVPATTTTTRPLTPGEKWELAQKNYDAAIDAAKDKKTADLDKAQTEYDAAVTANQSLPKAERKTANQAAKDTFNAAKATANDAYKASIAAANDAKAAAKAEWKATR